MVGGGFGRQQLGAADEALGGLFAHVGFGGVGQAGGHRSRWHKYGGQVAKVQRANQQSGDDFVAHPQQQRRVKSVVAERYGRRHCNHVAAEQAQFHARCALGHAVAHGGHAAGHLRGGTVLAGFVFDQVGVMLQRRVGREHVVIGRDDADVGRALDNDAQFVVVGQRGKSVGDVGAAQALRAGWALGQRVQTLQISAAGKRAALADALGDCGNRVVECHGARLSRG